MRIVGRVSRATAILFVLTGCAAGMFTESANAQTPIRKSSSGSLSPQRVCQGSFRSAVLLEWAPATVEVFRKYQYGGPKPIVPLAHVFASLPGSARGAWCGTKAGGAATHWWAVVVGQKPATLITIHGPGEGVRRGLVSRPPQVP